MLFEKSSESIVEYIEQHVVSFLFSLLYLPGLTGMCQQGATKEVTHIGLLPYCSHRSMTEYMGKSTAKHDGR